MLRALILEDSPQDVEIIRELLIDAGFDLDMDCTAVEKEFVSLLRSNTYDVILADFKLPGFDGFDALRWAMEICPNVPFICVSGTIGEETAVELLKLGAVDYVLKDRPIRLPSDIKRALVEAKEKERQRQAEEELRKSELRFKQVSESAHELVWEVDKNGLYTYVSPVIKELLGFEAEELIGIKYFYDFFDPGNKEVIKQAALEAFARKESLRNFINCNIHKDGRKIILSTTGIPILDKGNNLIGYRGVDVDITERKRAEEALLKLKKAVDNSGEVIFLTNKEGVFTSVNPAFTSIYGFTADEIVGKVTPRILKSGFAEANYYKLFWETLKSGKEKRDELINKRKDGTLINVEISASPIFDEKKNIIGFLGIQRDITARKRAEEEIAMLAHSLRSINESVIITDMEDKILFVNESLLKTYGYDENELNGKHISILRSLNNPPELVGEIMPATLRGGWKGELWNKRKDGNEFQIYLSTTIINDKDGKLLGLIGVATDITKRKLAEETLKKSEESYRFIVESTNAVIYHLKYSTMKYDYINPAIEKLTGYTPKEINEIGFKNIIVKISRYHVENVNIDLIVANREQGKTPEWQADYQVRTKDGRLIWLSDHSYPWLDETGNLIGGIGILEDITERKRAEKELIEAKERAEEMSRLKSNFLANMSHELRTPLNGILGYADLLTSQLTEPELIEMTQGIYNSGKRLSETLNFILDLSEAETNRVELTAEDIAVVPLVKNSISLFDKEAEKKNLQFETIIKEENIFAHLDERLFSRILYNLLDNALKFTKKGKISVEIGKELIAEKDPDYSGAGWFYIKIKDTGIGIAPDKIDLIWEEFRQVSEGLSRIYEGPGLGLTISKKAVELMEGKISVESELGVGSTFTVKFPTVKVIPQKEEVKQTKQVVVLPPKKEKAKTAVLPLVLYVEDDFVNRHIVKLFLNNTCIVETAEDGETALQLAAENKYELILMDINLGGGMNGMKVVKEILKMPQYVNTPIIAVTAYAMGKDKAEFIKGGCTHYISKPFRKHELIDLVTSTVGN